MAHDNPSHDRRAVALSLEELEPPPIRLLDEPLEYLVAEHFRHRCVCGMLRRLASGKEIERALAGSVAIYLSRDLPLHHQDEDEDLFPALSKRSLPEDGLRPLLGQLSDDHLKAAAMTRRIIDALAPPATGGCVRITRRSADLVSDYGNCEQRHLAIENGIVLVLARKRLKAADLQSISRSMKARRGVLA